MGSSDPTTPEGSDSRGNGAAALLLYRGPFQTSRLSLLTDACARAFGHVSFVWLAPRPPSETQRALVHSDITVHLGLGDYRILDGRPTRMLRTIRALRKQDSAGAAPVIAVGFTALPYARSLQANPLVWSVNGIPEERLLLRNALSDRIRNSWTWRTAAAGRRPDLVVTVSRPMSELIAARVGGRRTVAVPTAVDSPSFAPPERSNRRYLTYLGSGAPWQDLGRVNRIWRSLHIRRKDLRFRVVSKDERTRALGEGIATEAIDFQRADSRRHLAQLLHEAVLGFALRSDHLVNRTSFPTKIGQYLAAGAPVVTTDMDWDPAILLRGSGACVLVPPNSADDDVVSRVLDALAEVTTTPVEAERRCLVAAARLDRRRWAEALANLLRNDGDGALELSLAATAE